MWRWAGDWEAQMRWQRRGLVDDPMAETMGQGLHSQADDPVAETMRQGWHSGAAMPVAGTRQDRGRRVAMPVAGTRQMGLWR